MSPLPVRVACRLLVIAGGLVTVAMVQATPPVAADGVLLRYAFRQDDDLASEVMHRALTETTMNGITQTVETSTDSNHTWKVVVVDDEGTAVLEQVVDEVTMTSRSPTARGGPCGRGSATGSSGSRTASPRSRSLAW